jgi:hypothetical protein
VDGRADAARAAGAEGWDAVKRARRQAEHARRTGRTLTAHQRLLLAGYGPNAAYWLARWVGDVVLVERPRRPGPRLVVHDGRLWDGAWW